jgi:hypothetical protein
VYATPSLKFVVTSQDVLGAEIVQVAPLTAFPSGSYVWTEYPVIGEPFADGAVHETVTLPVPEVTLNPVGALGTPAGVTAADADDSPEVPTPFVVVALNVYSDPFASPETVHEVAGEVMVQVLPETAAPVPSYA